MWWRDRRKDLARRLAAARLHEGPERQLENGSRIAVIGGGPAGAFFSYFLLRMAARVGLQVEVEIYDPRFFGDFGPAGCNHCGGIISESLVQLLAMDGIHLPPAVVQRGIDAYVLHTDDGSVRIETPLQEKRIAAIYRGGGPRGLTSAEWQSFDQYLLDLAREKGARVRHELITDVAWENERPILTTAGGERRAFDLVVTATGVNSRLLERFEALGKGFRRPKTTTAFVSEFHYGREALDQTLGSAMHVFLLNIPRLEFAAIIPKSSFATLCLLGDDIDDKLVQEFLDAPAVKACFPAGGTVTRNACHCFPRINIDGAAQPFGERMIFIGDSGVTRLYKDGVGAAYRTGKAAALAAVLGGVSEADLRRHFLPACRKIADDNSIGKLVFMANDFARNQRLLRRTMLRMTAAEQRSRGARRHMSSVLWDLFTGSAPYREILLRALHPGFIGNWMRNLVGAIALRKV